jgi:uncharacterized membrane protein YjdF
MSLFTPARSALLLFTFAYLVAGTVYLLHEGNHEFLFYLVVLAPLIVLAFYVQVKYNLPLWMLWLISILAALHLAGGSVIVHGDVLYNLVLIPIPNWTGLTIWKFDQFVHPFGAFVVALCTYGLLCRSVTMRKILLFALAFMVANGAGALNEVNEFATTMAIPGTNVGGYYNTALDLTFNMIGAFLGGLVGFVFLRRLDERPVSR